MARQTVTITLYKSEILYDVKNKTYLTGRSRSNGNNHEEVAAMQANDDDENMNNILRSVGTAFAQLKTKLSEYLTGTSSSANDQLEGNTGNFTLALSMPENYNKSTADTIANAAHMYIVNSALGDWFTITDKSDAADYYALANANIEQIREALGKRMRPTRTTPTA